MNGDLGLTQPERRDAVRNIDKVFVHCSASSNPNITADDVDRWHKDRGWNGIGYHYFIRTDGTVERGRSIYNTPAAQKGHNANTVAICLNGLRVEDFTEVQFSALNHLCDSLQDVFGDGITFHGHREVAAKECPVFDYMTVLNLDFEGHRNRE